MLYNLAEGKKLYFKILIAIKLQVYYNVVKCNSTKSVEGGDSEYGIWD